MKDNHEKTNHAPGTGSDRHHPETPDHADERFKEDQTNKSHQDKNKTK